MKNQAIAFAIKRSISLFIFRQPAPNRASGLLVATFLTRSYTSINDNTHNFSVVGPLW